MVNHSKRTTNVVVGVARKVYIHQSLHLLPTVDSLLYPACVSPTACSHAGSAVASAACALRACVPAAHAASWCPLLVPLLFRVAAAVERGAAPSALACAAWTAPSGVSDARDEAPVCCGGNAHDDGSVSAGAAVVAAAVSCEL